MTRDELGKLARSVLEGFDARRPARCAGPLAGLTIAQAYALQQAVADLRERRGERIIGYKIGCTSRAIQDQLGIREPIFARIFDSGCFPSGSRIGHARFANPAIEGELAIRLARDLPRDPPSAEESIDAIAAVFPVIELHHYLVPAGGHSAATLIASGGMHAGLVLAEQEAGDSGRIPEVTRLDVTINDGRAGSTGEPWTMGGPAATLRWLAARLAGLGLPLRRGQVILTGSALPLFPVGSGSRVTAEARPLGRSSVTIE
jgi:2-keto-4-pentenoate hydratase